MCVNFEIASIIFEIRIVPEPATTSGTGLLDRDTGVDVGRSRVGVAYRRRTRTAGSEATMSLEIRIQCAGKSQ